MAEATVTTPVAKPAPAPAPTPASTQDADYVAAIQRMKADQAANYVPKAELDAALVEKKKLLDALVNGGKVEVQAEETYEQMREKMMKPNTPTREVVKYALKSREFLMNEGYPDPFESQRDSGQGRINGQDVADTYQYLLDRSHSDANFDALLQSQMPDAKNRR